MDCSKTNKHAWTRDRTSIRSLSDFFAENYLYEITPLSIENYKKRLGDVALATLHREPACWKHMFNKAIEGEKTDRNPAKTVKLLRENNAWLRYLTCEEIRRFSHSCADPLKPIILTALYTDMRRNETLKLKWEDVDLDEQIIFIRNTKNDEVREIPLNNLLTKILKNIKFRSPYVFCDKYGYPYGSVRKSFETALKKARIEDFCSMIQDIRLHPIW